MRKGSTKGRDRGGHENRLFSSGLGTLKQKGHRTCDRGEVARFIEDLNHLRAVPRPRSDTSIRECAASCQFLDISKPHQLPL